MSGGQTGGGVGLVRLPGLFLLRSSFPSFMIRTCAFYSYKVQGPLLPCLSEFLLSIQLSSSISTSFLILVFPRFIFDMIVSLFSPIRHQWQYVD